jgi:uncharacterized membrane protein
MLKRFRIWILIFSSTTVYSTYALIRHMRLESFIYDLGFYDQLVWLASRGKPLFLSMQEYHAWTGHFNPTMLLLAPLYWLWDNVAILLIFQAFFASLGALPVYLLALKNLKNTGLALLMAFMYLSFFGLANALAYDFHPLTIAVPLLAFVFWFYENKNWKLFWISFIGFIFLQENFLLLGFAYGIYLLLKYKDYRRGFVICVSTIVIYFIAIFIIMPGVGGRDYIFLPTEFMSPITSEKLLLVVVTLLAFGFLPAFAPLFFLMLLEEWGTRFMVAPGANYWSFGYHYNAILTPILAMASIEALRGQFKKRQRLGVALMLIGLVGSWIIVKPDVLKLLEPSYWDTSKGSAAKHIFDLIPPDAAVAASNNLGPHLTHREYLTFLTNCHDNLEEWIVETKRCFKREVDYVIVDLSPDVGNNLWPDNNRESILAYLDYLQKVKGFTLLSQEGTIYLFKK